MSSELHMWNGFRVDPELGIVYGKKGAPLQANARGHVLIVARHRHLGYVHRAVWEVVHGPIPAGMQINHKNGVKGDNRITNLELVTPRENTIHAYATGLNRQPPGEQSKCARLSAADVEQIRRRRAAGERPIDIAQDYTVSPQHIGRIGNGRSRLKAISDRASLGLSSMRAIAAVSG